MGARIDADIEGLARSQFAAFSREQALEKGFSPDQIQYKLDNDAWLSRARAVYALPGWPHSFEQRCMVAQLQAGPGSFLSHRCGAMLRRLDGVNTASVELTIARRIRRVPDVIVHYSSDATIFDWSMVGPLAVATPIRIIVDMAAAGASLNTLERIFECAQRRNEATRDALEEIAKRLGRRGKPGTAQMRALVDRLVADGKRNGSDAETLFFQILRDAGLPLPTRQKEVMREDGSHAYTDYAYEGIDAVLEVLGHERHSSRRSLTSDAERNNDLNLQRLTVLEFTWTHLTEDREAVVRTVTRLLRAHGRL